MKIAMGKRGIGRTAALAFMTVALTACGGSGSDGNSTAQANSQGTSYGQITGFGSVYVNGTHFNTDQANVVIDGQSAQKADLEKGMVVQVKGSWQANGEGVATRIEYDDVLKGPVKAGAVTAPNAAGEGSLTLLGQTVQFDGRTLVQGLNQGAALSTLEGKDISVSGWYLGNINGNSTFYASLIRVVTINPANSDGMELEGVIKNFDATAKSFDVGNLSVDYATAIIDAEDRTQLANGVYVEVEGNLQGGEFVAADVDVEDDAGRLGAEVGDDVELSGTISGYQAGKQLTINGVTVLIANAELDDDMPPLADGMRVEVEGEWSQQGVVADEIDSIEGDASVEGIIDTIDTANKTLTVAGVAVRVSNYTLIVNDNLNGNQKRAQVFANLQQGTAVEVEGIAHKDANGVYLEALTIEMDDDPNDPSSIEGTVAAVSASNFTLLGMSVVTDSATTWEGATSLQDVAVGSEVEVTFTQQGGNIITAIKVSVDND